MFQTRVFFAAVVALVAQAPVADAAVKFADKHGIFCGEPDCYEELGILQNATKAQIRKAYRKLSMEFHPDKNPGNKTAAERFKKIARANEILTSDEQRKKLDYYTENSAEYWSLYGPFVEFHYAPKTDLRVALIILLIFASFISPAIQWSKYSEFSRQLEKAALNKLPLSGGGSAMSLDIRKRAEALVDEEKKARAAASTSVKAPKLTNRQERERLAAAVKKLISEVEPDDGFRKPTLDDVFIVKFAKWPYANGRALYDRISLWYKVQTGKDLTEAEKQEVIEGYLGGPLAWDSLSDEDQDALIDGNCYVKSKFDAWKVAHDKEVASKPPAVEGLSTKSKKQLRQRKKGNAKFIMDE